MHGPPDFRPGEQRGKHAARGGEVVDADDAGGGVEGGDGGGDGGVLVQVVGEAGGEEGVGGEFFFVDAEAEDVEAGGVGGAVG